VGEGIRRSGVPREEIHVTTKIWGDNHGSETAVAALEQSRVLLGLDYIDLYLIHWLHPGQDLHVETWQALEKNSCRGPGEIDWGVEFPATPSFPPLRRDDRPAGRQPD
jgi:2,5-diketo-D-gluconate reductase A